MKHIFYEKYLSNNIYQQMEKQSRMPIQGRNITHLFDYRSLIQIYNHTFPQHINHYHVLNCLA